jgi:hypothetical protein
VITGERLQVNDYRYTITGERLQVYDHGLPTQCCILVSVNIHRYFLAAVIALLVYIYRRKVLFRLWGETNLKDQIIVHLTFVFFKVV